MGNSISKKHNNNNSESDIRGTLHWRDINTSDENSELPNKLSTQYKESKQLVEKLRSCSISSSEYNITNILYDSPEKHKKHNDKNHKNHNKHNKHDPSCSETININNIENIENIENTTFDNSKSSINNNKSNIVGNNNDTTPLQMPINTDDITSSEVDPIVIESNPVNIKSAHDYDYDDDDDDDDDNSSIYNLKPYNPPTFPIKTDISSNNVRKNENLQKPDNSQDKYPNGKKFSEPLNVNKLPDLSNESKLSNQLVKELNESNLHKKQNNDQKETKDNQNNNNQFDEETKNNNNDQKETNNQQNNNNDQLNKETKNKSTNENELKEDQNINVSRQTGGGLNKNKNKNKNSDINNSSPFITSEMYSYIMDNGLNIQDNISNTKLNMKGGGKKKKSKYTSSTESLKLEKKKNKSVVNSKSHNNYKGHDKKNNQSSESLNLSYESSSAHTGGNYNSTIENDSIYNKSSSVHTSDINIISDY